MNRLIAGSLLSLTLAASAGVALAQGQGQAQRAFGPADRVEARLAYQRTALKITDAQQAQWNAYADSVRKEAAARAEKMQAFREKHAQLRKERAEGKPGTERQRHPCGGRQGEGEQAACNQSVHSSLLNGDEVHAHTWPSPPAWQREICNQLLPAADGGYKRLGLGVQAQ